MPGAKAHSIFDEVLYDAKPNEFLDLHQQIDTLGKEKGIFHRTNSHSAEALAQDIIQSGGWNNVSPLERTALYGHVIIDKWLNQRAHFKKPYILNTSFRRTEVKTLNLFAQFAEFFQEIEKANNQLYINVVEKNKITSKLMHAMFELGNYSQCLKEYDAKWNNAKDLHYVKPSIFLSKYDTKDNLEDLTLTNLYNLLTLNYKWQFDDNKMKISFRELSNLVHFFDILEISSIDNTCGVSIFTDNKIAAMAPLGCEIQKCYYSQIPDNDDFDLVVIEYEGGLISSQHLNMLASHFQKKKIPVIIEAHELSGNELFYADGVIVHHNWKELMANPDMHYIPHPCQEISTVTQTEARELLNLPQDELIFVSPGRLEQRKLFHENIEGVKNYLYIMIGAYPTTYYYAHRRYLRSCGKYPNHKVIAGAPIPAHILNLYSQAADFLLFNNDITYYSISGSAMMSVSLGKPAFMRKVKLFDMFNDENSFKFNNVNELPEILKSATNDEILSKELKLIEMRENLKWPQVAHQYLSLYEQILEKKK